MKRPIIPYQPAWYPSPIKLPARTVGKFSVRHRIVRGETPVVGTRQAFTRGIKPWMAKLNKPLRIHELREDESLLMTDLPEELNQIAEMLYDVNPHGRVCVGGLGLGLVAESLATREGVDKDFLTVVELHTAVVKLCGTPHYRIVFSDILKYLRAHPTPFDYYLLDTWCGTSENTWWKTVLPLRRAIRQRWGRKPVIHCWGENIMWGQVKRQLMRPEMPPHWYYQKPLCHMTPIQAELFLQYAGLPDWEKQYGAVLDRITNKETTA